MKKENYEKEEWGGWKIVSDMLDHPDKNGIYPTSKCYQKLYEFVMSQKKKARQETIDKVVEILEEMKIKNEAGYRWAYNQALSDAIEKIKSLTQKN